jgi:hypothetical protein
VIAPIDLGAWRLQHAKLTQREAADRAGIPQPHASHIESDPSRASLGAVESYVRACGGKLECTVEIGSVRRLLILLAMLVGFGCSAAGDGGPRSVVVADAEPRSSWRCSLPAPGGTVTAEWTASEPELVNVRCAEPRTGRFTVQTRPMVDGVAEADTCGTYVELAASTLRVGEMTADVQTCELRQAAHEGWERAGLAAPDGYALHLLEPDALLDACNVDENDLPLGVAIGGCAFPGVVLLDAAESPELQLLHLMHELGHLMRPHKRSDELDRRHLDCPEAHGAELAGDDVMCPTAAPVGTLPTARDAAFVRGEL